MALPSGQTSLVLDPSWSLFMGDHRAGSPGSTVPGKRVARHAVEQPVTTPYAGRRAARPEPRIELRIEPRLEVPYAGRRVAGRTPVVASTEQPARVLPVGRRIALDPARVGEPPNTTYVGRRIATPAPVVEAPVVEAPVVEAPVVEAPVVEARVVEAPVVEAPVVEAPVVEARSTRPGRRAAARRTRLPSLPLLAGVAVLAVSAGGALQAVHPGLGTPAAGLTPTGVLAGDHSVASASLLAGRGAVVSRSSDRLQAAADAEAKQRDAALSAFAARAQKTSARIELHQWVLPVTPGTYQLTARFGQYSALWSNFHTGLDFAAPTGTPIMAVAAGRITSVGYSGAFGNRTVEVLPDGTELWYCHQNAFGTAVGDEVKAGQVIGYVGSTGNVTGPHLHLEVHPGGGDAVDPYPVLVDHGLYPGPPA